MTRKTFFACLFGTVLAANLPAQNHPAAQVPAQQPPEEQAPPEEDETEKPRTYVLNPLEAERNVKVGNFYMHQGTPRGYRAASMRFEEATKYNPSYAEAYLRWGEAEEKLKHMDKAKAAFQKAAQLDPESKAGKDASKKLEHLH